MRDCKSIVRNVSTDHDGGASCLQACWMLVYLERDGEHERKIWNNL